MMNVWMRWRKNWRMRWSGIFVMCVDAVMMRCCCCCVTCVILGCIRFVLDLSLCCVEDGFVNYVEEWRESLWECVMVG